MAFNCFGVVHSEGGAPRNINTNAYRSDGLVRVRIRMLYTLTIATLGFFS